MTYAQKHKLYRALNGFCRIGVPAIAAGALWGFFTVGEQTVTQQAVTLAGGVFVAGIIGILEGAAMIKKQVAQLQLDSKTVLTKNHTVAYAAMGTVLLAVQLFAEKAMIFCFIAAAGNAIAGRFEKLENKYYRLANPAIMIPGGVTNA